MKKLNFNQLCEEYDVSPAALRECMRKGGLKRKEASTQDVLDVIYLNCTDLLWCRSDGDGTVEYLNPKITARLVDHMRLIREYS